MLSLLEEIFYILRNIIPLMIMIMVLFTVWIGWRKGFFDLNRRRESVDRRYVIHGDTNLSNILNIAPSEMQKIAYNAERFNEYHQ